MHAGIMIRAYGDDLKDAQAQVESMLDDNIACGECGSSKQNVNWDYYTFVAEVTPAWIKKNRPDIKVVKTVQELIQHYIDYRQEALNGIEKSITEELIRINAFFKKEGHYPKHSMLGYFFDELDAINAIIDYGDVDNGQYTLNCTDNHYADLTEYTEGEKAFYMWFDRHY